jgi:hypothetical protein
VLVCDVAGRTGVYFIKSYVVFAEFVGAKILYALALTVFFGYVFSGTSGSKFNIFYR